MSKTKSGVAFIVIAAAIAGAVYLWMVANTPEVSGQLVPSGACVETDAVVSYDIDVIDTEVSDGQTFRMRRQISISGRDFHSITSDLAGTWKTETKQVGGVGYIRTGVGTEETLWQRLERPLNDITRNDAGLGSNPMCPDVSRFRRIGSERAADGTDLRRYTDAPEDGSRAAMRSAPGLPSGQRSVQQEVLVDQQGQLRELRIDEELRYIENGTPVHSTFRRKETFSGIGEANEITAPVVP